RLAAVCVQGTLLAVELAETSLAVRQMNPPGDLCRRDRPEVDLTNLHVVIGIVVEHIFKNAKPRRLGLDSPVIRLERLIGTILELGQIVGSLWPNEIEIVSSARRVTDSCNTDRGLNPVPLLCHSALSVDAANRHSQACGSPAGMAGIGGHAWPGMARTCLTSVFARVSSRLARRTLCMPRLPSRSTKASFSFASFNAASASGGGGLDTALIRS